MDLEEKKHRILKKIISSGKKVWVYGAGRIGTGRLWDELNVFGIRVEGYFDNDSSKWGKLIHGGVFCHEISELSKCQNDVIIIAVGKKESIKIKDQLEKEGYENIVFEYDIAFADEYVDDKLGLDAVKWDRKSEEKQVPFFEGKPVNNERRKKIALYTAITGGYDVCQVPEFIETDLMDYYLITDGTCNNETDPIYNVINIDEIVPCDVNDNIRKNRFCKIMGCEIFSNYKYSIYIDGCYLIDGKISDYIYRINDLGIALRIDEPPYDCVYVEGAWVMDYIGDTENVRNQMHKYYEEGMPRHWGMFCANCLPRENNNDILRKIMREWWQEVYRYSFRDQLSLPYIIWKNGLTTSDIGMLDGLYNDNKEFRQISKHR